MNRASAGFGAALGVIGGGVAGLLIGERIPKQPGYTPQDDEALVFGVSSVGALIGSIIGASIGAGSDPKQLATGVGHLPSGRCFP